MATRAPGETNHPARTALSGAVVALAGNPNAGKTSLFNELTGTVQHVSNYPGVTVALKEGTARFEGEAFTLVDLPGIYSLTAYSQEEVVARNFILDRRPDLVVDVLDASNLERNLYLATQFMEMEIPLVLVLNMSDLAKRRGLDIDAKGLAQRLGVPVVATVGHKGMGLKELLATCAAVIRGDQTAAPRPVTYGHEVDREIDLLAAAIEGEPALSGRFAPRWLAVKLLEGDEGVAETLQAEGATSILNAAAQSIERIERHGGEDAPTVVAERRYGFAAGAVRECLRLTGEARRDVTSQIDAVVCHRLFGPLILLGVVAALFVWVFKVSDEWAWIPWFGGWVSPTGFMVWLFDQLAALAAPLQDSAPMIHSIVVDAIIGGVGGVMEFVPLIFIMFLFVSALEDTGYIARVAFILDRLLHTFGLQGKSILAMIVSGGLGAGGCAVPGVLATRTMREEKDRLVTMLVVPFMNCGAKMPVYAMLIAAFFPKHRTQVMLLLWGISWGMALAAAWFLRRFVVRGEQSPFVMELPSYHRPVLRGVLLHTWERTWMYIRKAGTIILAISIVMWALMYFPRLPEQEAAAIDNPNERAAAELAHSIAGRLGQTIEPVSHLAGFDWQTNIALIGGFAAKEVVVSTLGSAYAMGEIDAEEATPLSERLARNPAWNPLRAFVLMIFVMIYAPCLVTIAVIRRESGSWKWALFSTAFSTTLAFLLAVFIYQTGNLLGLGG